MCRASTKAYITAGTEVQVMCMEQDLNFKGLGFKLRCQSFIEADDIKCAHCQVLTTTATTTTTTTTKRRRKIYSFFTLCVFSLTVL